MVGHAILMLLIVIVTLYLIPTFIELGAGYSNVDRAVREEYI
jgi:hypothetical protein